MSKCIWIRCNEHAWSEGDERSHFCLTHAWRAAARGQHPSHFVPNDAQRARMATFPDSLSNRLYFPVEYITSKTGRHLSNNLRWPCRGPSCDKIIISGVKYCGECRKKLGMPEDEEYEPKIRCSNAGAAGPGRYLNNECRNVFPAHMAKKPPGSDRIFCPQCMMRLYGISDDQRKILGYDF